MTSVLIATVNCSNDTVEGVNNEGSINCQFKYSEGEDNEKVWAGMN